MDRELAQHVAVTAFRSSANLNELVPLLRTFCEEDEYRVFLESIAAVSGEIACKILNKIYEGNPDIQQDLEQRINRYGFLISG